MTTANPIACFEHLSFAELHDRLNAYETMPDDHHLMQYPSYPEKRQQAIAALKQLIAERQAEYDRLIADRMVIHCPEYLEAARATADRLNARPNFEQRLAYVASRFVDPKAKCHIQPCQCNHPEYKTDFSWWWEKEDNVLMCGVIALHFVEGKAVWGSHT